MNVMSCGVPNVFFSKHTHTHTLFLFFLFLFLWLKYHPRLFFFGISNRKMLLLLLLLLLLFLVFFLNILFSLFAYHWLWSDKFITHTLSHCQTLSLTLYYEDSRSSIIPKLELGRPRCDMSHDQPCQKPPVFPTPTLIFWLFLSFSFILCQGTLT